MRMILRQLLVLTAALMITGVGGQARAASLSYFLVLPDPVNGSDGNFGYQYIHSSTNPLPPSGVKYATVSGTAGNVVGTLTETGDGTNVFNIDFLLGLTGLGAQSGSNGTVTGSGVLDFGVASGAYLGDIDLEFELDGGGDWNIADTTNLYTVGFYNYAYGSGATYVPNTLGAALALWGANGADGGATIITNPYQGFTGDRTMGVDLAFDLTPVPLPAAMPLFLAAMGGMGLMGWRRRRVSAHG